MKRISMRTDGSGEEGPKPPRRFPAGVFVMLLMLLVAPQAQAFDVTVSGGSSANGAWSGGSPDVWTPSAAGSWSRRPKWRPG